MHSNLSAVSVVIASVLVAVLLLNCNGLQSLQECDENEDICIAEAETRIPKGANELGLPQDSPVDCVDRHEKCEKFMDSNGCNTSPGWMIVNCPVSCHACHLRDPAVRCSMSYLNMSTTPAFAPGSINAFFENTLSKYGAKYGIQTHSRDPWLLSLNGFLSETETKALLSRINNWERSTDSGITNAYGEQGQKLSGSHTSSSAWCRSECDKNAATLRITKKISRITGVHSDNFELYQVIKYEVGQRYGPHFDYIPKVNEAISGPRVLSFFLYLSDVEEGGDTYFPVLNISITPKRGNALLWSNIKDDFTGRTLDLRTQHEGRPLLKGVKHAANAWVHQFNFKVPNLWGCTGAFDVL